MNKEEIYQKLFEYIDASKDWALEQAPELFQQIAAYGLWSGIIICGLSFVFFIISSGLGWRWLKKWDSDTEHYFAGSIICGVLCVISFICFCSNIETCIKAAVAPKLYILDCLRGK